MNDHDEFLERLSQDRAAQSANADAAQQKRTQSPVAVLAGFLPGDRVFDTVSGLEGVVIDARRQNVVVQAARG